LIAGSRPLIETVPAWVSQRNLKGNLKQPAPFLFARVVEIVDEKHARLQRERLNQMRFPATLYS
jgi:hypothetical protein